MSEVTAKAAVSQNPEWTPALFEAPGVYAMFKGQDSPSMEMVTCC
jgi:hypothetical protein